MGYRSSLTEIVQIIGRATRDAPGKARARFTNFIAEPDATKAAVASAINDTLKAIAASLLMEQVLAPRFEFTPKDAGPREGFDYGPEGYVDGKTNVGVNGKTGTVHLEIKGLNVPESEDATRICREDLNEVIAAFVQDDKTVEKGLFDVENTLPEELTVARMGKIVRERYPELSEYDQEAVRQHAIAAMTVTQKGKAYGEGGAGAMGDTGYGGTDLPLHPWHPGGEERANLSLLQGIRQFALEVRELDIDLIDRINPFEAAYAILAKAMDEGTLRQVQASIAAKRATLTPEEARDLAVLAVRFKRDRGRVPDLSAADPWEKRLAEGAATFMRFRQAGRYE